jgi:ectoine hydroxylase-related dioxygenase (phytanoyl-CoA dioxygenase family)
MNHHLCKQDWQQLTLGQQIQSLELEGYLVLPDLLDQDQIAQLKAETSQLKTTAVDYSVHQRGCPGIQFCGGAISSLIAHPPTIQFLTELFGREIVMMSYDYAVSEPGHPGISLHTDGQPYGSAIFGMGGSVPFMVRVLYYLDDLTPEVSPFRVVPRSHLSMHGDANPYLRYESHPEEVMVTLKAGSAVLLNHRVFHGNYPNSGDWSREMLAVAYRPAWAGPQSDVEAWDTTELEQLPADVQRLMTDRSQRRWEFGGGNKPPNMAHEAAGIDPSRWERKHDRG